MIPDFRRVGVLFGGETTRAIDIFTAAVCSDHLVTEGDELLDLRRPGGKRLLVAKKHIQGRFHTLRLVRFKQAVSRHVTLFVPAYGIERRILFGFKVGKPGRNARWCPLESAKE
jgi:hypothetical protein